MKSHLWDIDVYYSFLSSCLASSAFYLHTCLALIAIKEQLNQYLVSTSVRTGSSSIL